MQTPLVDKKTNVFSGKILSQCERWMVFMRLTTELKQEKKDGHATNMQKDGPFLLRKTPCGPCS